MKYALNLCLSANSPESLGALRQTATQHAKLMDDTKRQKAEEFKAMIDAARQDKLKALDITEVWFASIAKSVGAELKSKPVDEIVSALSAHHEFEQAKLQTALTIPEYNPLRRKNQNDIIDVEQLMYLWDESLCMLTADGGFKNKVTNSKQATRIITAKAADLMNAKRAEVILRDALAS